MPRISMDSTGNDSLIKTTKVTEWSFNYGGYITLAFGGFLLLGCVIAYVIAVARGNVEAFLPLISDAAGSPPQNGLFGTFICIGGMFGVSFMILRYMIVLEKNREKSSLVTAINKLSLFVGILSMLGITLVTGYPINFYRNRDVWLTDVGLPHIIGGVMLFALGLVYIALQCVLTLFLKTKNQLTLLVRVILLFICTGSFVYHMITVPDNFGGISHKYYFNNTEDNEMNISGLVIILPFDKTKKITLKYWRPEHLEPRFKQAPGNTTHDNKYKDHLLPYPRTLGASLKLPIDTSGSYIASSITEWIFVIFFCCFFFTFFNEAQQYSLLIVIETHSTKEQEVIEDTKAEIRRLSLAIEKEKSTVVETKPLPDSVKVAPVPDSVKVAPVPGVKKFLRRDSTCQTMDDGSVGVIERKGKEVTNGFKKTGGKPIKTIAPRPAKIDVANGTKKILTNADIDTKLNKLLNENIEDDKNSIHKKKKKETKNSETSCDDLPVETEKKEVTEVDMDKEAERIAIEKIDVVVKAAEEHADSMIKHAHEESVKMNQEENGTIKKSDSEDVLPSTCPLSFQ